MLWKLSEKNIRATIRDEVRISIEAHLEKAIEKGIINALKSFGADADNQPEVQRDFHFLRKLRKRSEDSSHMLMRAVISVSIGAATVILWEGIKILLQQ